MDFTFLRGFIDGLLQYWWLLPLFILFAFLNSATFKGKVGESVVRYKATGLDPEKFRVMHDVTLPTASGTTQIDHIFISLYGIFVVETKNYTGWIFGSAKSRFWTQVIYKNQNKFQNPLRQNYKHIKTLQGLLRMPERYFHSVIVFTGDCTFKSELPQNVIKQHKLKAYLEEFSQPLLSAQQLLEIEGKITDARLPAGYTTNRLHRQYLQQREDK